MASADSYGRIARPLPIWPWGLAGLITVPLAIAALITFSRVSEFVLFGDAEWYASAVPALTSGQPLYDPAKIGPHLFDFPHYWNQAPSTALFALVLAVPGDRWVWGGVMTASLFLGLVLIWPKVGPGGVLLLAPALVAWLPVTSALAWANINSLVFLLLAVAWRFPRWAGWAIGIAAAAKIVPVIGVAWLVGRRDWRAAGTALALLAIATAIVMVWKGPSTLSDFVVLRLNEITPEGARPRWNPVELMDLPDAVAYVAAAVVAGAAAVRSSFSLAIIAMLMAVPALHAHYLTWLLIPALGIWIPWALSRLGSEPERAAVAVGSGTPA